MSDILTIDTGVGLPELKPIEPLPLYDENHPMLQKAIPEYEWPLPNPNMSNLIARLKMTMKLYGGIGLSANQCGIFERVFIIGTDQFQIACINPKIIKTSEELLKADEGCLSFPGLYLKIERPTSVEVEFLDEQGETKQMFLEGLTARCFQHELDHMNGIRFVDYVKPVALKMAREKQQKLLKKMIRNHKKK